jgi:hypothetical protein
MGNAVFLAVRFVLLLLALIALGLQGLIVVGLATQLQPDAPRVLLTVYGVGVIAALVGVQVGLFAVWVLLSMVRRDVIFDQRAFRWVSVVTAAGPVAALPVAAVCMHFGEVDDAPGLILIGGAIALAGVAFALLMLVMRGLLRKATTLRDELAEVV